MSKIRGRPPQGSRRIIEKELVNRKREKRIHKKLVKEVFKLYDKFQKRINRPAKYHITKLRIPDWVVRHLNNPDQITPNTKRWFEYALKQDKTNRAYARKSAQNKYRGIVEKEEKVTAYFWNSYNRYYHNRKE